MITKPELGFSIKSQLGNPSTLLNAGKTTNFIYKIVGNNFNPKVIDEINSIETRSKIKERIKALTIEGFTLSFIKTENNVFGNNLILIDSLLPNILAELVLAFYSSNSSKLSTLVELLETKNPQNFNISDHHKFYTYKMKKFLTEVAFGMMPSQVWTGTYDATGGYIVVKEDGDVLSYHIYNKNSFEDYLFYNTKLETASSSRHNFANIYKKNNDYCFKLNLQIRFIK